MCKLLCLRLRLCRLRLLGVGLFLGLFLILLTTFVAHDVAPI